jgi:hypothetical protein
LVSLITKVTDPFFPSTDSPSVRGKTATGAKAVRVSLGDSLAVTLVGPSLKRRRVVVRLDGKLRRDEAPEKFFGELRLDGFEARQHSRRERLRPLDADAPISVEGDALSSRL